MILFRLARDLLALVCLAVLCGCAPSGRSPHDEEKEPHFQAGRARVNAMDYTGAVEAFAKALEVNPRSGAAHFELGCLYKDKVPDPAAAIYHYEQYLKLRPKAENGDTIRQHIFALKQDLAKAVWPLPPTPSGQRELDQLADENRRLRDELERWRAYYASRGGGPTNPPGGSASEGRPGPMGGATQSLAGGGEQRSGSARSQPGGGTAIRTHKVQPGDTLAAIAKRYGVKLEALMTANPGLNPKRLQIGQSLNVPAS